MRAIRCWMVGVVACAALAPGFARARERSSSFAVTAVSVYSVPARIRPVAASRAPERLFRWTGIRAAPARVGPYLFVDGAPAALTSPDPVAGHAAPGR